MFTIILIAVMAITDHPILYFNEESPLSIDTNSVNKNKWTFTISMHISLKYSIMFYFNAING